MSSRLHLRKQEERMLEVEVIISPLMLELVRSEQLVACFARSDVQTTERSLLHSYSHHENRIHSLQYSRGHSISSSC